MSLQLETRDPELSAAVQRDWRTAPISERESALLTWAEKLTLSPAKMSADDLTPLMEHGLSHEGCLDLAQVVAYFNYINRMADGLGVDLEDFMSPPAPDGAS